MGSGPWGEGTRSGTAGRGFEVSVGERGLSRSSPLWASKGSGLLFGVTLSRAGQGSSSLCLCCCVCVVGLLCLRPFLGLDVLVALCTRGARHAPRVPSLGSRMPALIGIVPIGCFFSCVTSLKRG